MARSIFGAALLAGIMIAVSASSGGDKAGGGVTIDKEAKTVTITCKVAPRKLPNLKQIYPLEVVACWPAPKGQKAHETIVVFDAKPSEVHKALESLGLKAGKPGLGEVGKAAGPEVSIFLEIPGDKAKLVPIEEAMVDTKSGKTIPPLKFLFTGSAVKFPDPEKDDKVYGADLSGTLITLFPVTDDTVFQTTLGAKEEGKWRLEVSKIVPKEGTALKLVIKAK
jgi:hypothetical protein